MSYISQVDYKKLMSNFQKGTPKGLLKELHSMKHDGADESQHLPADAEEGLEKEGNAFTAGLAKAKKGQEFKVGEKSVKDTSNYDSDLEEYQFDQMYPDDPGPFEEGKGICPSCGMPSDQCQCGQEMDEDLEFADDDEEDPQAAKDARAKKMEDDDTDAENAEGDMEEGFNPDESDFERAVAEELESLPAEALTDKEYQKALELLEDPKIVSKLWDVHPRKAAMALAKMVRGKEVEEGLHMPPLQATGQTVVTNEDAITNPGMGFGVLSPDERQQLKEYINSYKTIKSEISKLLEKAGKSGKIMEGIKEDEAVPAERKAKYKDPTTVPTHHKHSNLGGNRTGLVMTKAEMWENEEHEEGAHERIEGMLDTKLHDAFHKVTGMIMKDLMADGFDEGDIKNFLQHEIDEKAKEAINAQHDF